MVKYDDKIVNYGKKFNRIFLRLGIRYIKTKRISSFLKSTIFIWLEIKDIDLAYVATVAAIVSRRQRPLEIFP